MWGDPIAVEEQIAAQQIKIFNRSLFSEKKNKWERQCSSAS
jgi:hypothetical protein